MAWHVHCTGNTVMDVIHNFFKKLNSVILLVGQSLTHLLTCIALNLLYLHNYILTVTHYLHRLYLSHL